MDVCVRELVFSTNSHHVWSPPCWLLLYLLFTVMLILSHSMAFKECVSAWLDTWRVECLTSGWLVGYLDGWIISSGSDYITVRNSSLLSDWYSDSVYIQWQLVTQYLKVHHLLDYLPRGTVESTKLSITTRDPTAEIRKRWSLIHLRSVTTELTLCMMKYLDKSVTTTFKTLLRKRWLIHKRILNTTWTNIANCSTI
jgi:hypothetical protein